MAELRANFSLQKPNLQANFNIQQNNNLDAVFKLNATPTKVSELQNDLDFQTKEQVDAAIEEATQDLNQLQGSALIGVTTENKITTISSKTFVFEQGIPATQWVINHNLNKRPSIQLVDSTGREFEAVKDYTSSNQVIITLEAATSGFAYLN